MISIPLFLNQEQQCSYLDAKTEQSAFVHPDCNLSIPLYSRLLEQGFRRSGSLVYKPFCKACSACIPVRILVNDFQSSRSQKRILKNQNLISVQVKPAVFDETHYDLYLKYQRERHPGGGMADSSPEQYLKFLSSDWCSTVFVEFSIADTLVAVAVVDQLNDALSAVYTFFDPDYSRFSLGSYAVLWQIKYALRLQKPFLYMGYWIEQCQKMSYKNHYRPLQAFIGNEWRQFKKNEEII